jgi:hypothetical protein
LQILRIPSNHVASLDPRTRSAMLHVVLGQEQLARFHEGRATIRASAIGGPQWLRTPPPLVRTLPVVIVAGSGVGTLPQRVAARLR